MAEVAVSAFIPLALATQLHRVAVEDRAPPHAILVRRSEDGFQLLTSHNSGTHQVGWILDPRKKRLRAAGGTGLVDVNHHDERWAPVRGDERGATVARLFEALVPETMGNAREAFAGLRAWLTSVVEMRDWRKRALLAATLYSQLQVPDDPGAREGRCSFVDGLRKKFVHPARLRALGEPDAQYVLDLTARHPKHAVACMCVHTDGLGCGRPDIGREMSATMLALDFTFLTTHYAQLFHATHFWGSAYEALNTGHPYWPSTDAAFRKLRTRWHRRLVKHLLGRLCDNIARYGWSCPFYCIGGR